MDAEAWRSVQHLLEEYLSGRETDAEEWSKPRIADENLRREFLEAVAAHEAREATWTSRSTPDVPGFSELTLIGSGGQSEVYRALQLGLESRRVALKLPRKLGLGTAARQRFKKETAALASLRHSNVAQVYDTCQASDGRPVLVMELVEGLTLTSYCRSNRPSLRERIGLVLQVSAGVAAAHAEGIVHRDLKPSNVLIQRQVGGTAVKVIDFGVAKHLQDADGLTAVGGLVGTFHYMSPEQLDKSYGPISPRTDVYALGILLYELAYDRNPFAHVSSPAPSEHLVARTPGPPRPPELGPGEEASLRLSLEPLLDKALAPRQEDRYAEAAEFHRALSALVEAGPTQTLAPQGPLPSTPRRPPWAVAAIAATAAALTILLIIGLLADNSDSPASPLAPAVPAEADNSSSEASRTTGNDDAPEAGRDQTSRRPSGAGETASPTMDERLSTEEGVDPTHARVAGSWPAGSNPGETRLNPRDGLYYSWVPAGEFSFGCSPGDSQCEDDEKPPIRQRIERGFWLGRTEVTARAFREAQAGVFGRLPPPSFNHGWAADDHPIVNLTRNEAESYCKAVASRLPTETEWEYAARAGRERGSPTDVAAEAWFAGNSLERTHAVAQKRPNRLGLYDTLGNAAEWVADAGTEPTQAVLRGGSWRHEARYQRFSFRLLDAPSRRESMYGFRCVIDPD